MNQFTSTVISYIPPLPSFTSLEDLRSQLQKIIKDNYKKCHPSRKNALIDDQIKELTEGLNEQDIQLYIRAAREINKTKTVDLKILFELAKNQLDKTQFIKDWAGIMSKMSPEQAQHNLVQYLKDLTNLPLQEIQNELQKYPLKNESEFVKLAFTRHFTQSKATPAEIILHYRNLESDLNDLCEFQDNADKNKYYNFLINGNIIGTRISTLIINKECDELKEAIVNLNKRRLVIQTLFLYDIDNIDFDHISRLANLIKLTDPQTWNCTTSSSVLSFLSSLEIEKDEITGRLSRIEYAIKNDAKISDFFKKSPAYNWNYYLQRLLSTPTTDEELPAPTNEELYLNSRNCEGSTPSANVTITQQPITIRQRQRPLTTPS